MTFVGDNIHETIMLIIVNLSISLHEHDWLDCSGVNFEL